MRNFVLRRPIAATAVPAAIAAIAGTPAVLAATGSVTPLPAIASKKTSCVLINPSG